uniref:Protein FAM193A n=1 Tax=Cacopsylla melanoneura TaxID=428564 RepID=A0A8D9FHB0_9HEMI
MTSSNSLTKKKQTLFVNMGDVLAKETEQVKVEEQSWDNREDADGASSVEDSIIRDLQERLSLTVGASDDNYESDDSNTQCDCDACQEPIMSIRNPHFDRVQEHWQKLRTFIQIVYKSAIQGKPLEPAYQKQIQSIIHELATLEPHLLYKQLEAQIQEWVIETELRQLESLLSTDNVDNIPHLFISGLLESYKNLMTGADLAFPILEELQASHLSKFNITWQLLNEHIYQSCVYADPLVQNNVPVFIGKLSSTSESMESNKDLVKEFLYLDDNINSVSELWVECKRALEEYAEEQALIQGRRALLEMEWKCFKAEGGGGGGSQRKTSLINKTLKKIVTSEKQCLHSKDGASCKRSKCVSESTSNKCASLACDCMKFSHDITLSHLHQGGTDQSHSPGRGGQCLLNGKIDLSSVVAEHKLCADSSCGGTTSVVNSLTFDLDIDERPTSSTQPHTPPSRVTSSANSSVPVSHSHPPANNTGIKTATTQKLMKAKVAAAADLAASLKCRSKAPPSSGGSSVRGGTCHKVRSGCSHHTHKHGGSSNVAPEPIKRIATCEAHRTAAGNSAQSHHEDEDSDTCGGGSCSSCTPPDDSASDQSSVSNQKSSSSNVSDPRHCDCCYCEVFGHGVPSGAPVSRNYQEIRERLRLLLNKKKNNNKKNAGVATATESSNMMHGQSNARSGTGDQQLLNKLPTPRHLSAQQLQQQQQQASQSQQSVVYKGDQALSEILNFIEGKTTCKDSKKAAKKARQKEKKLQEIYQRKLEEEAAERAKLEAEKRRKEELLREKERLIKEQQRLERELQKQSQKANMKENNVNNSNNNNNNKKGKKKQQQSQQQESTTSNKKNKKKNKNNNNRGDEMPQESSHPSSQSPSPSDVPKMVTIKRVMETSGTEPTVTITLRGATPNEDKVLYTLQNGHVCPIEEKNRQAAAAAAAAAAAGGKKGKNSKGGKQQPGPPPQTVVPKRFAPTHVQHTPGVLEINVNGGLDKSGPAQLGKNGKVQGKKGGAVSGQVNISMNANRSAPSVTVGPLPSSMLPSSTHPAAFSSMSVVNVKPSSAAKKTSLAPSPASSAPLPPPQLTTSTAIQISNAISSLTSHNGEDFNIDDLRLPPGITITKVVPPMMNGTYEDNSAASSLSCDGADYDHLNKENTNLGVNVEQEPAPLSKKSRKKRNKQQKVQQELLLQQQQQQGGGDFIPNHNTGPEGTPAIIKVKGSMVTIRNPSVFPTNEEHAHPQYGVGVKSGGGKKHGGGRNKDSTRPDDWNLVDEESVFAPKDIDLENGDIDDAERELEAFKRFCSQSVPPKQKEKVHLNIKDIVLKKKRAAISCS